MGSKNLRSQLDDWVGENLIKVLPDRYQVDLLKLDIEGITEWQGINEDDEDDEIYIHFDGEKLMLCTLMQGADEGVGFTLADPNVFRNIQHYVENYYVSDCGWGSIEEFGLD